MDSIKLPGECDSLAEVRTEIDRIDHSIIKLIARRKGYVMAAARFKTNLEDVAAPQRFAAMLEVRRAWAIEQSVNPDMVEKLYREMVGHFIVEERTEWEGSR
jgi:isochorismate pyruvate lyase